MSNVHKRERSQHRLTVLDKALDVYDHTTNLLANEKVFKRTYAGLILRMKALVECGILVKHDVDKHFKAFKSSVRYGNSHNLICRLNRWYESLWKGAENVIDHHEVQDNDRRA